MSDTKQIDDGGFAFPSDSACPSWQCRKPSSGMTLRDWFAGQALIGLMANSGSATAEQCLRYGIDPKSKTAQTDLYAAAAYAYARAMLAARKEKQ